MNVGAIIFSRTDSKRLPGKALIDINGKSLLERVIERTKKIQGINKIVVATTNRDIDNEIESISLKNNVLVYRGSLNNLVLRALNTCKKHKLNKFVRICGDRPFFDPFLISKLLITHNSNKYDVVTTMYPKTLPVGLTVEILSFEVLQTIHNNNKNVNSKEHISKYIYDNPQKFSIKNHIEIKYENFKHLRFVVDTEKDLVRTKWVLNEMKKKKLSLYNMLSIISFTEQWNKINK